MKSEIEKILDQHTEYDDQASKELQKLFLSKQIELLESFEGIYSWVEIRNIVDSKIIGLKKELKQLQ